MVGVNASGKDRMWGIVLRSVNVAAQPQSADLHQPKASWGIIRSQIGYEGLNAYTMLDAVR